MAAMELFVVVPGGQGVDIAERTLRADLRDSSAVQVCGDRVGAGVAEAQFDPDIAAGEPIAAEILFVALPHRNGRMARPFVAGNGQRPYDLDCLDPLLAETFDVEHTSGLFEIGVRQERLHVLPRPLTP